MTKQTSTDTQLAVIANDISYIKEKVQSVEMELQKDYVTRQEFEPIRNIIYGLISLVLVTVVGALLAVVVIRQ